MRLSRLRRRDRATPVVALECDGNHYDVSELEARWFSGRTPLGADFFERVVSRRAAGLRPLYDRLLLGDRPTEARLVPGEYVPLPPTDDDRCAFFRCIGEGASEERLVFEVGNSRCLLGDGVPASYRGRGTARCAIGLAVVLGEDLEAASEREAKRAVLGYGLMVDWMRPTAENLNGIDFGLGSHFGPDLWIQDAEAVLLDELSFRVAGLSEPLAVKTSPAVRPIAEVLTELSQRCRLRAGDVVGLGQAIRIESVGFGQQLDVQWQAPGFGQKPRLRAYAVLGSSPNE